MSGKPKDISGQQFGRLTALYRLHNTKGRTKWLCVCECGDFKITTQGNLHNGQAKSCGCLWKEWCNILGLNYKTVTTRVHRGWSIERALELNDK